MAMTGIMVQYCDAPFRIQVCCRELASLLPVVCSIRISRDSARCHQKNTLEYFLHSHSINADISTMNNEAQNLSFQALQEDLQAICDAPNGKGSAFFESSEFPPSPTYFVALTTCLLESAGFKECSRHYLTSSSDMAAAAVQPVGEEDLAKIIQVIAKHRFRFAVSPRIFLQP